MTAGPVTWSQAQERLAGYLCLWQDLDGMHVARAPVSPPLSSILWAWPGNRSVRVSLPPPHETSLDSDDSESPWLCDPPDQEFDPPLLRLRLEGPTVYTAVCSRGVVVPVQPWGHLAQVAGMWSAPDTVPIAQLRSFRLVEVHEALPESAGQAVVFICPAGSGEPAPREPSRGS